MACLLEEISALTSQQQTLKEKLEGLYSLATSVCAASAAQREAAAAAAAAATAADVAAAAAAATAADVAAAAMPKSPPARAPQA